MNSTINGIIYWFLILKKPNLPSCLSVCGRSFFSWKWLKIDNLGVVRRFTWNLTTHIVAMNCLMFFLFWYFSCCSLSDMFYCNVETFKFQKWNMHRIVPKFTSNAHENTNHEEKRQNHPWQIYQRYPNQTKPNQNNPKETTINVTGSVSPLILILYNQRAHCPTCAPLSFAHFRFRLRLFYSVDNKLHHNARLECENWYFVRTLNTFLCFVISSSSLFRFFFLAKRMIFVNHIELHLRKDVFMFNNMSKN